jgi:hypothetical protein
MKIQEGHSVENPDSDELLSHRRRTRKLLEDRLERQRLREELDDFDTNLDDMEDEFDWHDDVK